MAIFRNRDGIYLGKIPYLIGFQKVRIITGGNPKILNCRVMIIGALKIFPMIPISDNSNNEQNSSWLDIRNRSLNFWMGVEAGRQAAYVYNKMRNKGDSNAQMRALDVIAQKATDENLSVAQKEFEFASEQINRSSVFQPSNLIDGEVIKITE